MYILMQIFKIAPKQGELVGIESYLILTQDSNLILTTHILL